MDSQLALDIHQLHKWYGNTQALRGLNLCVKQGEIFGFLGPNGAGKTTTIRCILNLIHPSSGSIRVLGLDPQKNPTAVHRLCGYLPGDLRLDEGMTVGAALDFFSRLRKKKPDTSFLRQLAERLDLDLRTPIRNLSRGNRQKAGLVQALIHRPALLLLDEPTVGLDPLVQQEVLNLIREASAAGTTVFFSSHVLSEVQEIASRVGIIRKGVLVEEAEPSRMMARSIRRARIRFRQAVDIAAFQMIPGIQLLSSDDGKSITVKIEGEMDALIKTLAGFTVLDMELEKPSLEEIFLAYYRDENGGAQ